MEVASEELSLSLAAPIHDDLKFQHTSLDHSIDSIRLIYVLSELSPDGGLIQVEMQHSTIEAATYTCLSYEWGSEDGGGGWITINGRMHYVRQNLLDFLEVAKKKERSNLALWIDALCINQGDNSERYHQVHQMGKIYSEAREIWIWLGNDSMTARHLARLSYPVSYLAAKEMAVAPEDNNGNTGWAHMCRNKYWTRTWIMQEIALARRIRLLAEDQEVHESLLPPLYIPLLGGLRNLKPGTVTLAYLLQRFRDQKCSIRRDAIYSLLALCREGPGININYETSDLQVFLQAIDACSAYMCSCTVNILATALGVEQQDTQIDALFQDVRVVAKHSSRGWCSSCPRFLHWEHSRGSFYYHEFCIKTTCRSTSFHLCLVQPVRSGGRWTAYVDNNNTSGTTRRYFAHVKGALPPLDAHSKWNIKLSLPILMELASESSQHSQSPTKHHLNIKRKDFALHDSLANTKIEIPCLNILGTEGLSNE